MTPEIALVLCILIEALALLVTELLRMDVLGLLVLAGLALTRLVAPAEALVEARIAAGSRLAGHAPSHAESRTDLGVNLLAARRSTMVRRTHLAEMVLEPGDWLRLQSDRNALDRASKASSWVSRSPSWSCSRSRSCCPSFLATLPGPVNPPAPTLGCRAAARIHQRRGVSYVTAMEQACEPI